MILSYEVLSKLPRPFRTFTGVSLSEFNGIYHRLRPVYERQKHEHLSQRPRERAVGGGRKYEMSLRNRLLMTLVWLRLYLTGDALGFLFGVHKSSVSRNTRFILTCLREMGEDTLDWTEPPGRGQGRSLAEAMAEYPELLALVDATEQRVHRSQNYKEQKAHYSGKKKAHTRKTQIIVNEHGQIRDVSASVPGSVHDLELFRQSGAKERIPKEVTVGGDAGYQGLDKVLPDHSVVTPHKATRGHPLDGELKRMNREFSRIRIVVENTIGALKHFRVLADVFRHDMNLYDDTFQAVVSIVNPRIGRQVAEALAAFEQASAMPQVAQVVTA